MEGHSPGSSEAGCSSAWREESSGDGHSKEEGRKEAMEESMEKERMFCSWDSPCNRGCAPLECMLKLPTTILIHFRSDSVRIKNLDDHHRFRDISYSNCLRTMSSSQESVERITCLIDVGDFWTSVGEVCEVLKSMPSVKEFKLYISDGVLDTTEWAEALLKLVAGNSTLIEFALVLSAKVEAAGVKLLVDALLQNQALQNFELSMWDGTLSLESVGPILEDLCRYAKSPNNVLTTLWILDDLVSKDGVEHLAALICNNKSLKGLRFKVSNAEGKELHTLWDSLGSNTVLEKLTISGDNKSKNDYMKIGPTDMKALVKVLIPNSTSKVQPNSSLRELRFENISIGIEDLTTLLQFNTSLLYLKLWQVKELMVEYCECAYENVEKLLASLQSNVSLEVLGLKYCTAIGGKKVLGMIMDMLLHNHTIKEIALTGTPLKNNDDDVIVKAELSKREEENLWKVVQDMDTSNPDSARLFLCGKGEAGKTTLSNTWRASSPSTTTPVKTNGIGFDFGIILRKLFACMACQPRTENPITLDAQKNDLKNERTRGIEVHNINVQDVNINIWDMAGQEEYHTFHDWMIPNRSATGNCCIYVILCDPTSKTNPNHIREISNIKRELLYWLQFVASNTRRSSAYRPHVTILFTHADLWGGEEHSKYKLIEAIHQFQCQFQDLLEVDTHQSFFINARSQNDGSIVISFVHNALRFLLERLPKEIKACKVLRSIIHEKTTRGDKIQFFNWNEFSMMCEGVDGLKSSEHIDGAKLAKKKEFVATSLHDGGFIIYFKGIDIVILNPHWFCHDIMGELLFKCTTLNPNLEMIKDGVISKNGLQEMFTKSLAGHSYGQHFGVFLNMMMKLQFCYEQDNDNIMVPSTLRDTEELNWQHVFYDRKGLYNYVGTRLASKDETLTILTPGFFPRLQVFLRTKFCTPTYKSYKDIISFMDNDIEIIIACDDGAINIMSRSYRARDHIVHKKINNAINELRSISTLGCPGVILEEYVMRPQCVKQWSRGIDVHLQVVSKKELRKNVLLCPDLDYQHHWIADERYGIGCDSVKDLLGDEEWGEVLQIKDNISKKIVKEVQRMIKIASDDVQSDPRDIIVPDRGCVVQSSSTTNEFNLVLNEMKQNHKETQRTLEGMDKKMDRYHEEMKEILKRMENKIISSQEELVSKICSNINELMQFSKQLQQSKVPKLAYFSNARNGGLKNLLTRMIPGVSSGHLHLMCEHQHGIHIVDDQHGFEVQFNSDRARQFGTIMYWGLAMLTLLLKVGAHVTAGAGGMVPDLTKDIMLILDAPGLVDLAQPKGPMLEGLPPELRCNATITDTDKKMAEDWLIQLLKPKCDSNEIHKIFKLNKVVYTYKNAKHAGVIAWICDHHKERGEIDGILECV